MSISKLRRGLYLCARKIGDVTAIAKGDIAKRVISKLKIKTAKKLFKW